MKLPSEAEIKAVETLTKRIGRVPTFSEIGAADQQLVYSAAVKLLPLWLDALAGIDALTAKIAQQADELQAYRATGSEAMGLGPKRDPQKPV